MYFSRKIQKDDSQNLTCNPFAPKTPYLCPLKTSEILTVCWCFQGVEERCIGNKWVNGCNVGSSSWQKHLGLVLDEKLNFDEHIQSKISNCNIIKRLSITFLRDALLTIYKSLIRPHLDYADIIYDNHNNELFSQKNENF